MNPNIEIQQLQEQVARLQNDFNQLSSQVNKNNFTSHQDFTKSSTFYSTLKIPSFTTLPTCEVGQICESGGKAYICSATNTWTIIGTQS